ncbi:GntR family transcriptional regulator [Priestia sp. SIMBA_032]|uniref:GntR family transcriptional regulator n=1 Tax=Priestia sp. SIMBA_032 TaxID=3085775 RepID=UPI00397AEED9
MYIEDYQKSRYLVIMDKLKEEIEEGNLTAGERLPSETELAKNFKVSRSTVREALRALEQENIVTKKHGIGTFINQKPLYSNGIEELFSVTDLIQRKGYTPGTKLIFSDYIIPDKHEKQKLSLKDNEKILLVKRIRTSNGDPLVYCIDKVPQYLLPNECKLDRESIFDFLEAKVNIKIDYATTSIGTTSYLPEISDALKCDMETPLLILKQSHYDENDRLVLYSINYFRSDNFNFHVFRKRLK